MAIDPLKQVIQVRIAHITTVHPREDARIRVKEVGSLANAFEEPVALFVQDGKGDCIEAGGRVRVIDIGPPPAGRLARMTLGVWRMWRAVYAVRPQVVHFHDPELIPLGFVLKCFGHQVVYDVHEDVPRQILMKYWLPVLIRRPVSWVMSGIELLAGQAFDAIVPAEPITEKRFPPRKTVLIQNFPILSELVMEEKVPYAGRPPNFSYIGSLTRVRGSNEMVSALSYVDPKKNVRLCLAGAFQPVSLQTEMEASPGWQRVEFLGWASRTQVAEILGSVRGGLVILHPTPKYLEAYPTKMFEYMSVGLPVIVSDFPLWRRIVDSAGCGLLVDPLDPRAIAEAMQWILDHPAEAEDMGQRGRQAVEKYYNWESEADKLVTLYKKLLSA